MILLYRLLFVPALILALPAYLPRMLRRGGYAGGFSQRFGVWRGLPPKQAGMRRIWIHAVSVGEILALKPLLDRLQDPDLRVEVVLTTTTSTAHAVAVREFAHKTTYLAYFPLDFWLFSRRAWQSAAPDLCVLTEGEIWPEHLHQARLREVPVMLINARMSNRSYQRWRIMPRRVRGVFSMLHRIVAASEEDGQRFTTLGANQGKVVVSGNLKLDFSPEPILTPDQARQLRRELGLDAEPEDATAPLILAGASTWPGEEDMLLRVWQRLKIQGMRCKLLLIPRHAERGSDLRQMLGKTGLGVHFRSDGPAAGPVDVAVADTTGEMVSLLQMADAVFVGKSMASHPRHRGGQNPIEAAALGKVVAFGPNMQNFSAVARSMLEQNAATQVADEQALFAHLFRVLGDPAFRTELGAKARAWHETGKGATGRTFAALREVLES